MKSVLVKVFTPQKLANGLNRHPKIFRIKYERRKQVKCIPDILPKETNVKRFWLLKINIMVM